MCRLALNLTETLTPPMRNFCRAIIYTALFVLAIMATLAAWLRYFHNPAIPHLVLLGAMSADSAHIWVRCTGEIGCQPSLFDSPMVYLLSSCTTRSLTQSRKQSQRDADHAPLTSLRTASVSYRATVADSTDAARIAASAWFVAQLPLPDDTGTAVVVLQGLQPDTEYEYTVYFALPSPGTPHARCVR